MSAVLQLCNLCLICLLSWCAQAPPPEERRISPAVDAALRDVERAFKQSPILKAHPGYKVTREGNSVKLSYHPRVWVVYGSSMSGEWSKTPHNETGPDSDGLIITVSAIDLKDAGQEQFAGRAVGLDLRDFDSYDRTVGSLHVIREPYWSIYCCGQELPKRGVNISCNIEFNNRTDRKMAREAFAPVAAALSAGDAKRLPARTTG